jgi:peptide/nickel transport system ATP-binding protein
LLQLKRQFGISLIYITHDLTTAYQISDRIVVLYRGEVVEEGEPDQIVNRPQHPYTRLLINSIPEPDPDHAWIDDTDEHEENDWEVTDAQLDVGRATTAGQRTNTKE